MEGIRKHDFSLPEEDEALLNASFPSWETVRYGNENWLIINQFSDIPPEYRVETITVALLIPESYPKTQIDMFYVYPGLSLPGRQINATQVTKTIGAHEFQRWSRHRTQQNPWRPGEDNVHSQIALVEEMLLREVSRENKQ